MATEKSYFEKVAVRKPTKRKIEVLSIFYGSTVNLMENVADQLWEKALEEGKVNDAMLAEPTGEVPPVELPA